MICNANCVFVLVLINCVFGKMTSKAFPSDFLFGVASSAYQIEGGHDAEGKGENIWDYFTRNNPEKFQDGSNGNVACNSYYKYKEDVELLAELGVQFYRFSIMWSRILPNGYSNNINKNGLKYYNNLINELLAKGIQPMITMYHWDLPMPLHEIGGWNNPQLAYYFEDYARILYNYFGDRVKYWITLNVSTLGYGNDVLPPFINQPGISNYLCQHVMLLAHARAYHAYDNDFRKIQKGKVGIVSDSRWFEPFTNNPSDIAATERTMEFEIGLTLNPIFHRDGDYPKLVKDRVAEVSRLEGYLRSRLPVFSPEEVEYIKGSADFLGMNVYTQFLVKDDDDIWNKTSDKKDIKSVSFQDESWPKTSSSWLKVTPEAARKVLKWVKDKYSDPEIIITENGMSDSGEINDLNRIQFLQDYLSSILEAIHEDGVNVKAYAAWSLLDNFEWIFGYRERFGLYHVDFTNPNRTRTPKKSAEWYKKVIKERRLIDLKEIFSRHKEDL